MLNAQVQNNSQNTNKEKQNVFPNFVLTTPVLNVTGMSSFLYQKGALCAGCNLWIHQKCAGITKAEYRNIGNNKEEPLYCRYFKANMFPFYGWSNYQFYNFVSPEISETKTKSPQNKAKTKTRASSNTHC